MLPGTSRNTTILPLVLERSSWGVRKPRLPDRPNRYSPDVPHVTEAETTFVGNDSRYVADLLVASFIVASFIVAACGWFGGAISLRNAFTVNRSLVAAS